MNIFIDTATFGCNLAIFNDNSVIVIHHEAKDRGHAEHIMPLIEGMLTEHNKTPQDIENIFVTVGPGSFTGLRVGLTTAQFMGFSLQKPVCGISTFQAFSCGYTRQGDRTVIVETKRSDYYMQVMDDTHKPLSEPLVVTPYNINGDAITGDAVNRFVEETGFSGECHHQNHTNIEAVIKAIQSNILDYYPVEAFYIRDADVSQPKATTR